MAFKVGGSRWTQRARASTSADVSAGTAADPHPIDADRKPAVKIEPGTAPATAQTGLAARVDALWRRKHDVKPRVKRERFDDDEAGRGRSRTRGPVCGAAVRAGVRG